jgi:predicted permease
MSNVGVLIRDLRYGFRTLAKAPGFTVITIMTLALGIASVSTIFSWISATLLDPVPGVADTRDLMSVMRGERVDNPTPPFSYADYLDLRDRNGSFSGLLAYHDDAMSLTGGGKPVRIYGTLASSNYFEVLGVQAILGRGFLPSEGEKPGGASVVVLGYGLWQGHFGADRAILGRTIEINRSPFTVIGVTPPGFQGAKTGIRSDFWIPDIMDQQVFTGRRLFRRDTAWLQLLGRLRPGVDRQQAQEELNVLMQQIAAEFPNENQGSNQITLDPLWRSPFGANVYLYRTLPLLLAIACVVLLLACANVANLLLVRSVGRRREVAIRLSIGASRWRLVRQLLAESLALGLGGGALAVLLTTRTAGTFSSFIPPGKNPITLDGRVDTPFFSSRSSAARSMSVISRYQSMTGPR